MEHRVLLSVFVFDVPAVLFWRHRCCPLAVPLEIHPANLGAVPMSVYMHRIPLAQIPFILLTKVVLSIACNQIHCVEAIL
jgi:hypothetical protein